MSLYGTGELEVGEGIAKISLRFVLSRVIPFFTFHKDSSSYTNPESAVFQMIRFGLATTIVIPQQWDHRVVDLVWCVNDKKNPDII